MEDVGAQGCKGVANPTGVFRVRSPTVGAGVPFLVRRDEDMGLPVRRWEVPEDAFPSKRLGAFLSVRGFVPCDDNAFAMYRH